MKPLIKNFSQFLNEGHGPAHTLLRKIEKDRRELPTHAGSEEFKKFGDDVLAQRDELEPEERDRFTKLAHRTAAWRSSNRVLPDQLAALKSNPKILHQYIVDGFGYQEDAWISDLVDEFVSTDMQLDDLVNAILQNYDSAVTNRNWTQANVRKLFLDLAKRLVARN